MQLISESVNEKNSCSPLLNMVRNVCLTMIGIPAGDLATGKDNPAGQVNGMMLNECGRRVS